MNRATRRAAALLPLLTVSACAINPAQLPLPGAGVSGHSYRIHIEFADVLNLPDRAKVVANGAQVGVVTAVRLLPPSPAAAHVMVDADISSGVDLPATTTAAMRQNTLLGDIHIALTTPPREFGQLLHDGDTIPVRRTLPTLRIEDTLATLATFVQGGAINHLQDILNDLNAALPAEPRDTARIFDNLGSNVTDLARHLDQVDDLLDGLTADSAAMNGVRDQTAEMLTNTGVNQLIAAVDSLVNVIGVLGAMAPVAHALTWLAPPARSADAAARAFVPLLFTARPLDLSAPSNLNALVALLRDKVLPFVVHGPKADITGLSVTTDQGATISETELVNRTILLLRMIGAVR